MLKRRPQADYQRAIGGFHVQPMVQCPPLRFAFVKSLSQRKKEEPGWLCADLLCFSLGGTLIKVMQKKKKISGRHFTLAFSGLVKGHILTMHH